MSRLVYGLRLDKMPVNQQKSFRRFIKCWTSGHQSFSKQWIYSILEMNFSNELQQSEQQQPGLCYFFLVFLALLHQTLLASVPAEQSQVDPGQFNGNGFTFIFNSEDESCSLKSDEMGVSQSVVLFLTERKNKHLSFNKQQQQTSRDLSCKHNFYVFDKRLVWLWGNTQEGKNKVFIFVKGFTVSPSAALPSVVI